MLEWVLIAGVGAVLLLCLGRGLIDHYFKAKRSLIHDLAKQQRNCNGQNSA